MLKHIVSFYIKDIDCNITKLFWNIKMFFFHYHGYMIENLI